MGWRRLMCGGTLLVALAIASTSVARTTAYADDNGDDTSCTDDAILVFDASGSMASVGYNELSVPRIFEALDAVRYVLPKVEQYRRIGLVTYGPGPKDACSNIELRVAPERNSATAILAEIERLTPDGNTPLTRAVLDAAETLQFRERPAVVVLVTDGEETCGGSPCSAGMSLRAEGAAITVHVIGFKVRDRFFQWESQSDGEKAASASRCLAEATGGRYVTAETTEELIRALQATLGCPILSQRSESLEGLIRRR